MNEKTPLQIHITPGTVVLTVLILGGFWVAWYLRDVLLVVLTAVILASSIEPITLRMVRWGIPRVLSVILIYLLAFLSILALFYLVVPRMVTETRSLIDAFPAYLQTFEISPNEILISDDGGQSLMDFLVQFKDILGASSSSMLGIASAVFGGVMSFFLIVVLSFYFAVQERGLDDFIRMITPYHKQEYMLNLWKRAQHKMGRWLQGQLLLSFLVGAMAYVGLLILGVPYALLLGILTALFELVPVFGSILAAIPAVAIALLDGGTASALFVVALYVIVNQLQGNIIYPIVVQKVLGIPPLVVILAILAGAKLGSYLGSAFLGILIAVPLAAAIQVYVGDVQRKKRKSDDEMDEKTIIA